VVPCEPQVTDLCHVLAPQPTAWNSRPLAAWCVTHLSLRSGVADPTRSLARVAASWLAPPGRLPTLPVMVRLLAQPSSHVLFGGCLR
jgi:hypothetical protein